MEDDDDEEDDLDETFDMEAEDGIIDGRVVDAKQPAKVRHYGTKPAHFDISKIHFPTNEGVSEVSERSRGREQSEQSGVSKQVSGASEWTSEWPSTYVSILVCSGPLCEGWSLVEGWLKAEQMVI